MNNILVLGHREDSIKTRIETCPSLTAGLKADRDTERIPLKQGLKPDMRDGIWHIGRPDTERIPLKQGLKL